MPVVGVPIAALNRLLGKEIPADELFTHLERLGNDVDGIVQLLRYKCGHCGFIMELVETEETPSRCASCARGYDQPGQLERMEPLEVIRLELLPVRPDLFDVGGLARALKGYLGLETGIPRYPVARGKVKVTVDPRLSLPTSYRPAISCAVLRGVTLDDEAIKTIMKMQENLHWALGRNRKHASIGVYDLDTMDPEVHYEAVDPKGVEFVPLNGLPEAGMVAVTPHRILEEHPKGRDFRHLLEGFTHHPLLRDKKGQVLSNPPVINSQETRVTGKTRNLFVDVTGFNRTLVSRCVNIVVSGIVEMDPRVTIESVEMHYPDGEVVVTPDMSEEVRTLDARSAAALVGMDLSTAEVAESLRKMRYDVTEVGGTLLEVVVPAYRTDILHDVDLMEDVAMGYGFHRIERAICPTYTSGSELPLEKGCGLVRRVLTGLGFLETMSLMLTSVDSHYGRFGLTDPATGVVTLNPASMDQAQMRTHLREGVLQSCSLSVGDGYPQRFFEIGDVVELDPGAETGTREERRLTAAVSSAKAGYAEIRSVLEALFRELGVRLEVEKGEQTDLIAGRTARILVTGNGESRAAGWMGEVHPAVLTRFSIVQPVALFEIDLEVVLERAGVTTA